MHFPDLQLLRTLQTQLYSYQGATLSRSLGVDCFYAFAIIIVKNTRLNAHIKEDLS